MSVINALIAAVKASLMVVLPRLVEYLIETIEENKIRKLTANTLEGTTISRPRKKPDTTRLTQSNYDFIIHAHKDFVRTNKMLLNHEKQTLDTLVSFINSELDMNKSKSALARVWNGHVDRDSLPK